MPRGSAIYSRVRRITLYPQDAEIKGFFTELDSMPADIANRALIEAVAGGYEAALRNARAEVARRKAGLPKVPPAQQRLLDLGGAA